jgi:iron complex transport system permease protein
MKRPAVILFLLMAAALAAAGLGLACGSTGCARWDESIVLQLRLPRVLAAFATGALLSLAGALMQVLLRNPLADPYVLGISGGAAVGALLALAFLPALAWAVQAGALAGALLSLLLLLVLVRRAAFAPLAADHVSGGVRLILTGVMLAAAFGAVLSLLLALAPDNALRGVFFWLLGDLENSRLQAFGWAVLGLCLAWSWAAAPRLNVLAHGDATAWLLGVPVGRLKLATLVTASMATAAAVSMAGTIGFIGLVVPHVLRLMLGNDQRLLLPACTLGGGAALVLADLLARTLVAPVQLPVGVVTVLAGVPVFLYLLARSRA